MIDPWMVAFWSLLAIGAVAIVVRAVQRQRGAEGGEAQQVIVSVRSDSNGVYTNGAQQEPKPLCAACSGRAKNATHPMPIIAERYARGRLFGAKEPTGQMAVVDDPNQPNVLCATHHRMTSHMLNGRIKTDEARAAQAAAEASKAMAMAEGGGVVEIARRLEIVIREDAQQMAEAERQFPKQLEGRRPEDQPS